MFWQLKKDLILEHEAQCLESYLQSAYTSCILPNISNVNINYRSFSGSNVFIHLLKFYKIDNSIESTVVQISLIYFTYTTAKEEMCIIKREKLMNRS